MSILSDNKTMIHCSTFVEKIFNDFKNNGYYFNQLAETNIKTISAKRNMSYEYYIKQPKHMVEIKLNQILARNPHLINSLDRRVSHPLITKYSHIPFSIS